MKFDTRIYQYLATEFNKTFLNTIRKNVLAEKKVVEVITDQNFDRQAAAAALRACAEFYNTVKNQDKLRKIHGWYHHQQRETA